MGLLPKKKSMTSVKCKMGGLGSSGWSIEDLVFHIATKTASTSMPLEDSTAPIKYEIQLYIMFTGVDNTMLK